MPTTDDNGNANVNLATKIAGERIDEDVLNVENQAHYTKLTAAGLIKTGSGRVFGLIVSSHSSGTVVLWDNTAASGVAITGTYTFPAGSSVIKFPAALKFNIGLYCQVIGTPNVTVLWK